MKNRAGRVVSVCLAVAAFAATQAKATDNIGFTLAGERGTAGVLTGVFYGLSDTGISAPTGVYISGMSYYSPQVEFTEYLGGPDFMTTGGFDIQNGAVVSGQFGFEDSATGDNLTLDTSNYSFSAMIDGRTYFTYPQDQPTEGGGISLSVSPAPEPSTWALMFLGLGGIGLMMRQAKKTMSFRFKDALVS